MLRKAISPAISSTKTFIAKKENISWRFMVGGHMAGAKAIKDILTSMKMTIALPEAVLPNEYSVDYEQADLFMDDTI